MALLPPVRTLVFSQRTNSVLDWLHVRVNQSLPRYIIYTLHPPDPCPLLVMPRMCQTIDASTPGSARSSSLAIACEYARLIVKAKLGIACREKVTPTSPSSTGAQFLISIVGIWGHFQDNRSHSARSSGLLRLSQACKSRTRSALR